MLFLPFHYIKEKLYFLKRKRSRRYEKIKLKKKRKQNICRMSQMNEMKGEDLNKRIYRNNQHLRFRIPQFPFFPFHCHQSVSSSSQPKLPFLSSLTLNPYLKPNPNPITSSFFHQSPSFIQNYYSNSISFVLFG